MPTNTFYLIITINKITEMFITYNTIKYLFFSKFQLKISIKKCFVNTPVFF